MMAEGRKGARNARRATEARRPKAETELRSVHLLLNETSLALGGGRHQARMAWCSVSLRRLLLKITEKGSAWKKGIHAPGELSLANTLRRLAHARPPNLLHALQK